MHPVFLLGNSDICYLQAYSLQIQMVLAYCGIEIKYGYLL